MKKKGKIYQTPKKGCQCPLRSEILWVIIRLRRNMTFDNTTYDQLAEMTADVLAQVVAAEPEVRL